MSTTIFTIKNLTDKLGISRQAGWAYLNERVKIPKDYPAGFLVKMSQGVYRDILDNHSDSVFRSFSVSKIGKCKYEIRNLNESESNPTTHPSLELKRALHVSEHSFADITTNVLKIAPHRSNRYRFSDRAFSNLTAIYGPK